MATHLSNEHFVMASNRQTLSLSISITPKQRELLDQAAEIAPGASTVSGVIRKAIDSYMTHLGLTPAA